MAEVKQRLGKLHAAGEDLGARLRRERAGRGRARRTSASPAARSEGLLFRKGKTVRKVREDQIVDALIEEIAAMERPRRAEPAAGRRARSAGGALLGRCDGGAVAQRARKDPLTRALTGP